MSTETPLALEQHYTVQEIADRWRLCPNTVREWFRNEPGVLHTKLRTLRPRKRENTKLTIPESVVLRVHAKRFPG